MHYVLDLLVIITVIFFMWRAAKKGFVKTVILFLGFLIAAAGARIVSVPLSETIYETAVEAKVVEVLDWKTAEITGSIAEQTEALTDSLPAVLKNAISVFGGDSSAVEESISVTGANISTAVEENIIAPAVIMLIQTILFIILFSVFLFVVKKVGKMMGFVNKIPLVGRVNVFLGGVLGTLEGVIVVFVAVTAIYFIMLLVGEGFIISPQDIDNSTVYRFFHENNPLVKIM